jgi:ribonuclease HI
MFKDQLFEKPISWTLYIDGAARNNPGLAGAGICLYKENLLVESKSFFLGVKTNNQAEYFALLLGLFYAQKLLGAKDTLTIYSDSELLIRQLQGLYAVKDIKLKLLYTKAKELLSSFNYKLGHVLRAYNCAADKLANQGIDKQIPIPLNILTELEIFL